MLTHDTTPPELTAFTFAPSDVDAQAGAATVDFTLTVTDDLSGVASIQILVTGPAGVAARAGWFCEGERASSTTQVLTVTLPQYSAAGAWTVSRVELADAAGNTRTMSASDLTAGGFASSVTVE